MARHIDLANTLNLASAPLNYPGRKWSGFFHIKSVYLSHNNSSIMTQIAEDNNGEPIYDGDIVIDSDGQKHEIKYSKHRELHGFGYVYGYYIPDYCIKIINND